ncbi:hypothetical protein FRC03_000003 [Tulasnella sp. 419]|nr:hypothetical protein FRC03_000003 [Tulasnella sp. 419]
MDTLAVVDVHTPTTSFSIPHSLRNDTLEMLFQRLSKKVSKGNNQIRVGPGWLKYEWNISFWTLDDESDYAIFTWRLGPTASTENPTLFLHDPEAPLPVPPAYQNPSYYAFRAQPAPPAQLTLAGNGPTPSIRSVRSKRSTRSKADTEPLEDYKTRFNRFHTENGVRTVTGKIGPVENVRMLLKQGHRHVYLSRSFAQRHGFIPEDTSPGYYGYGGLVQIGKWPITLGSTTSTHDVYLSEEVHFDVRGPLTLYTISELTRSFLFRSS